MSKEKTNTYTQCYLKRRVQDQDFFKAGWLPTVYAVKDTILEIKNKATNEFENGWIVSEVWTTMDAKYVEEHERDYLIQRKGSDI